VLFFHGARLYALAAGNNVSPCLRYHYSFPRKENLPSTMRILLAEDDDLMGNAILTSLRKLDFSIDWVRDGRDVETALATHDYGMLILDLGLPHVSGLEILDRQAKCRKHVPVLVITARGALEDRVSGLNAGADDYLVKPFNLDELVARVFALRRRSQGWASSELLLGALSVDSRQRQVKLAGEEIHLSDREFRLLVALIEVPGSVLSVTQLEERLYGWGEEIASNSIEVQLHRLRKKLGKEWIRNVRGIGFKLVDPAA
jgi:two-component system response regulator QseB